MLPAGERPDLAGGSITFIGTATALIRYGGFTIITDPNFLHRGERVHLGYGLRSTRLTEPAMTMAELPPLDFVVLSHLHEDHFDRGVQARLDRALPIVTTRSAAAIPIHYNDYTVFKSPLSDFQREVEAAGLQRKVRYLSHGETYQFEVPAA